MSQPLPTGLAEPANSGEPTSRLTKVVEIGGGTDSGLADRGEGFSSDFSLTGPARSALKREVVTVANEQAATNLEDSQFRFDTLCFGGDEVM